MKPQSHDEAFVRTEALSHTMEEEGRYLDTHEARVLGVLLEKEQTTPDHYPLTINAVISGCNQKSNRDPVTNMSETEVVEALDRLRAGVIAWRTTGPRAEKWEHSVGHRWHLAPRRKAVLTLLLLRGPQTPGELKSRSERMHSFESVPEVEETLSEMAEGPEALVAELPRVPGQRGRRWKHLLFSGEDEVDEPRAEPGIERPVAPPPRPAASARIEALETAVEELGAEVERIGTVLARLQEELGVDDDS